MINHDLPFGDKTISLELPELKTQVIMSPGDTMDPSFAKTLSTTPLLGMVMGCSIFIADRIAT